MFFTQWFFQKSTGALPLMRGYHLLSYRSHFTVLGAASKEYQKIEAKKKRGLLITVLSFSASSVTCRS